MSLYPISTVFNTHHFLKFYVLSVVFMQVHSHRHVHTIRTAVRTGFWICRLHFRIMRFDFPAMFLVVIPIRMKTSCTSRIIGRSVNGPLQRPVLTTKIQNNHDTHDCFCSKHWLPGLCQPGYGCSQEHCASSPCNMLSKSKTCQLILLLVRQPG